MKTALIIVFIGAAGVIGMTAYEFIQMRETAEKINEIAEKIKLQADLERAKVIQADYERAEEISKRNAAKKRAKPKTPPSPTRVAEAL